MFEIFFNDNTDPQTKIKLKKIQNQENTLWILITSALFFLLISVFSFQHLFFPIKNQAFFENAYLFLFACILIQSGFFMLLTLRFFLKKKALPSLFQTVYIVLFSIDLTLLTQLDLRIGSDISAFAIGIFFIPFIYHTSIFFYPSFIIPMGALNAMLIFWKSTFHPFSKSITVFSLAVFGTLFAIFYAYNRQQYFLLKISSDEKDKELRKHSFTDPLTHLFNRSYLFETLNRMILESFRYQIPLSFLMIEIHYPKHTKRFEWKKSLKEISKILSRFVRKSDFISHFSGNQFFIILSHTPIHSATLIANRIQKKLNHSIKALSFDMVIQTLQEGDNPKGIVKQMEKKLLREKFKKKSLLADKNF